MREFQNVSILDHPSIIKPYDLYINKITERIHYVMEYAKYKSLNHYLVKNGAFQETNTINIIRKLLVTLNYMHNKGICHRDITPKNVLVSADYKTIKIIDFGVSKQFAHYFFKQGAHFKKSMKMFTYTGVCQYMAPEILRGEGYNYSVDIWSVGVLTYQLMSGTLPYNSDYVSEILELIMAGDLNFPSNFSHLSKDFIKRILNPDCKKRLTAKEALNHPWLFLQEKEEVNSIGLNFKKYSQKKPSILTISALRNRIPSIDDIEIDKKKHTFSRFKEKFKEKMIIQGLDLHVHTIENKPTFSLVSPKIRALGKSSILASANLVLENRKVKTGKSFENNEEEKA